MQEDATTPDDVHLVAEVQSLRNRRLLRTLAVVQDLSDALMAVNDVTGKRRTYQISVCQLDVHSAALLLCCTMSS